MRAFYCPRCTSDGSADVRRLLAFAVREMYGVPLPRIEKTGEGKPFFPDRPDICFSLSHAKRHVLCAVGDAPVGADIENRRSVSGRLVNRFSTPEERERFAFLELWVLKESRLKLMGGSLPGLRDVHFRRDAEGIVCPDPGVRAALYRPEEDVFAAVCCRGEPPERLEPADPEKVYSGY